MLSFLKHHFLNPLKELLHDSKAIGVILLCCTILSLLMANLQTTNSFYNNFWNKSFVDNNQHHLQLGFIILPNSLQLFINDVLMAIFFFLVSMEIKREITQGELSSLKKATMPAFAAVGGMLIPAIIFFSITQNTPFSKGWAIPTATDIAFTLGIASLLGKRLPNNLKIFLMALAIIDDLGAIIVIALFYGSTINVAYLSMAIVTTISLYFLQKTKFGAIHLIAGILLWYFIYNSGIHATIAGVVFGLFIPNNLLRSFEIKLHNWVYFLILPLFVLANTAINISSDTNFSVNSKLIIAILTGLIIGKPLGIVMVCFILHKLKLATLPNNMSFKTLLAGGFLAGIGFTMSIFVSTLAFENTELQNISKISILIGSMIAAIAGIIVSLTILPKSVQYINH